MRPTEETPQAAFLRERMKERLRGAIECPICSGTGKLQFRLNDWRKCPPCRGTGKRRDV
jgi:DnaJ-class molecular chaperone